MIDLRSDTSTRPTTAMRQAMMAAEVGDEQKGEDPTVNCLLDMVIELLGQEAALFLPSGTMCNLVAIKAHTQPGETILADRQAHLLRFESGGSALASGVIIEQLPGIYGRFTAEDVIEAIFPESIYSPTPRLLCVEQTHNLGGGTIWPLKQLQDVAQAAHERRMAVHMDGARLLNAVVASGVSAHDYSTPCDSVWIDFTKGLGAPMGAVLAGPADFIERARRYKHLFGGALRQAGIAAAGCIYALEQHVKRLAEDHENARVLSDGLRTIDELIITNPVETNIIFFDIRGIGLETGDFLEAIRERDLIMGQVGKHIRAVTHLDVSREDVEQAVAISAEVIANRRS